MIRRMRAVAATLGSFFQRERANVTPKENQRRLVTLIDALPGIVFSCINDGEWSMSYLSEGCFDLTGYHNEDLVGAKRSITYNTITHPDDLPAVLEAIDWAIANRQPYVIEYRIQTKTGQEKWFWEKGHGLYDATGDAISLAVFSVFKFIYKQSLIL